MKLVVDANILFAALIKEGSTAELLISDKLQLFAPEFLFEEFSKYKDLILKKTHRSNKEFNQFLDLLKEQITIVPKKEITPLIEKAEKISPDPKDTIYLALALALNSNVWSNDKKLKEGQKKVIVFSTEELIKKINLLKS
ncbi:MAG: PIN domain-containing protein [Promethearchaeota archaeon]|nr:MAG: PIN domain-containing protein [Candidatus Lokiarchaeota archaeon]